MNLFLISHNISGYAMYEAAIVCAETEDEARKIHPSGEAWDKNKSFGYDWCDVKDVQVKIIGVAARNIKRGVVLASYVGG